MPQTTMKWTPAPPQLRCCRGRALWSDATRATPGPECLALAAHPLALTKVPRPARQGCWTPLSSNGVLQVSAAEGCTALYLRQLCAAVQAVSVRPGLLLCMRRCSAPDVCVLAQSDLCNHMVPL